MRIKICNVTKVRAGDTFTANNPPELAGRTVFEAVDYPGYGVIAFFMTDGETQQVDRAFSAEIQR